MKWAAVKGGVVVHSHFDATQEVIDRAVEALANSEVTPEWYDADVEFVDVSGVDPRPTIGFYKAANGRWVDGNPHLTTDRPAIPADGVTAATVTFTQKGPGAPAEVVFDVNGQVVTETLGAAKSAMVTVTSTNPGDRITVGVLDLAVTILVED